VGDSLQALTDWLSRYGYPLLFGAVFAESAGVPVPGETSVLAASLLASRPGSPLSLLGVILVTVIAAVLGDNLGFWVGRRWARGRLVQGKRFLILTPKTLQAVEGYFEHYGSLTIFFARFVTGLRVVAALAAGTSAMTWPRFLLANAGGAVVWAVAMSLLGYFFGHSWQALHHWMGRGALIIAACVALLVGLAYLWKRWQRLPAGSWGRVLRSQTLQGILAAVVVAGCLALLVMLGEHHRELKEDTQVQRWVAEHEIGWLHALALGGSYLGSLPVIVLVVAVLGVELWHTGRPWREVVTLVWALAASEAVGLILLNLLRHKGLETPRATAWPFGFAGLAPLRAAAVYPTAAYVLGRQIPSRRNALHIAASVLVLLVGFSVVWTREQSLSEVLVEYVAGYLVLFTGRWWLEGYGLGLRPFTPQEKP
jgi:membrane protein DedA with SNARE-associated domain